ncbi:MAG: Gfo/Idh/MocA family oxidoreductase [Clostridia bacterium]|nr:Gfo/Idh/MocA family oxidoreductase [Clostridia bacterium]
MFRVGIIGCGGISAVHAQVLSELENTELAACADLLPERAGRYGCAAYADYRKMLDAEKLDAVHLCTPHHLHPVMAAEAARRGVAVFTEKPPAIDAAGWEQVKRAAARAPVGVCFQNRYHPHVRACLGFLKENTYGPLRGIRAFVTWNRTAAYYAAADWKGKWATEGGGALINQAVHTLDLIIGFLGAPDQAEAALSNRRLRGAIQVEDTAEIYLNRGGVPALMYASNAYSQDAPVMIELHFDQAVIRLEGDLMMVIQAGKRREIPCVTDPILGRSYWGAGHKACIADFYRSVETGQRYQNDPASCEATMETLLKLYAQARR